MAGPDHSEARAGQRVTWVGAAWNALLILAKFCAGFLGRSQALVADAVHSVSDFVTDVIVLVGIRMGRKAPDADHHFGHARIETLASALVGASLVAVAVLLGFQSAQDIYQHRESHPTWLALAGASLSIVVKELLYHYTVRVGRRIRSPAVIANAWHHRSDALSSVAVLIGVAGAQINPGWHFLDAVAALIVSLLIAKVGLNIIWMAASEMTDKAPSPQVMDSIRACVHGIPGVLEEHDVKARTSGGLYHVHVHIVVDGGLTVAEGHRIAKEVQICLERDIENMGEVIVHVDPAEPPAPSRSSTA